MSRKAKIVALISIIAALGAIVILMIILMTGNNKASDNPNSDLKNSENKNEKVNDLDNALKNISDYDSLEFILVTLNGYWTFDNQFLAFTSSDSKQFTEYGLHATSYSVRGEIKNAKIVGENSFSLDIFIPAVSATEMDDARPEKTETIYVDISNFKQDGRITAKIENLGDGEWHTYEYGGKTLQEAYSN